MHICSTIQLLFDKFSNNVQDCKPFFLECDSSGFIIGQAGFSKHILVACVKHFLLDDDKHDSDAQHYSHIPEAFDFLQTACHTPGL